MELAQHFTPAPVARLALVALAPFDASSTLLDPTCGDGAFLAAACEMGLRRVVGIEIDDAAAARVEHATVHVADALAPGLPARIGAFDLVVGNPPWIRAGDVDANTRRARAEALADDWPELDRAALDEVARSADASAAFVLRALRFCKPGGRVALVLSTALLDADCAAILWKLVARVATVRALIAAPRETWFADATVNSMIVVLDRAPNTGPTRVMRLHAPTASAASPGDGPVGLDAIAARCDVRVVDDPTQWAAALRAPSIWFEWQALARDALVPLGELADIRRGLTTGANHIFYLRRKHAKELRLETKFLQPVVRSPFNGAPAAITASPADAEVVAIALPPDHALKKTPNLAGWILRHEAEALATSANRRDPWWSLPHRPARLFLAKAYGPRFVQRFADAPMLFDQRLYALEPKPGVDIVALAAVLNALPTALALESLGRASMGNGAVEWSVADAATLPVLDVRKADGPALGQALAALASRPIEHARREREREDRAALDRAAVVLVPSTDLGALWDGLLASIAARDRQLRTFVDPS